MKSIVSLTCEQSHSGLGRANHCGWDAQQVKYLGQSYALVLQAHTESAEGLRRRTLFAGVSKAF